MPSFKIVATKEKNGIYFSAVPEHWEQNKILYWPGHLTQTNREALRQNCLSFPEENWEKFNCVVKCSNLLTFKDALILEKNLTKCSDSEAEEELFNLMLKADQCSSSEKSQSITSHQNDVVSAADEFIDDNNDFTLTGTNLPSFLILENEATETGNTVQQMEVENTDTFALNEIKDELFKMKSVIYDMKNESTKFMKEVREHYAKTNVYLDQIYNVINEKATYDSVKINTGTTNRENLLDKFKFPISSSEEIELLEQELKINQQFKKEMVNFYSQICGRSGENDGLKAAYKISDLIFCPNLLTNYSWTGVSRGKNLEKKAFQIFTSILDLYFQILILADDRFTLEKTRNVFKENILKHAKKRSERKRPQHTSNDTTTNTTNTLELEDTINNTENTVEEFVKEP